MAPESSKIKSTKLLRSSVKGQLTKLYNAVVAINPPDPEDIDAYRARLSRAKQLFTEFENYDKELMELDPDNATTQSDEVFEVFVQVESVLKKLIRKCTPSTQSNSNDVTTHDFNTTSFQMHHQSEPKLPKLVIPKFNGEPLQWQSFFDLFSRSVHENHNISAAQKMGHLLTLLEPTAERVIQHLPITDANYEEAITLLKNRFDKKHHIVNSYIKTFLNLPQARQSSPKELRNLLDTTNQIIRGLSTLGSEAEGRDPWLVYLLLNKLDPESQSSWAQSTTEKEFPTLTELLMFLEKRSSAIESVKSYSNPGPSHSMKPKSLKGFVSTSYSKCSICSSNDHQLYACKKFQNMSIQQRRQCVKADNRCFNCLTGHHGVFKCMSKYRCNVCGRKHHSLLHTEGSEESNSKGQSSSVQSCTITQPSIQPSSTIVNCEESTSTGSNSTQSHVAEQTLCQAVLPTALVYVTNSTGERFICRALLDSGSVSSFVTENCCQRLRLIRRNGRKIVTGVGNVKAGTTNGMTTLFITSLVNDQSYLEVETYILSNITNKLPEVTMNKSNLEYLKGLQLADPYFNVSSEIDILIGIEHFFNIMKAKKIHGLPTQPIAQDSIFGYIIGGKWESNWNSSSINLQSLIIQPPTDVHNADEHVDKILKRFWEIEEVVCPPHLTEEEEACEAHFAQHTQRTNGRFVVKLPLRDRDTSLGTSLPLAVSCLKSMERKFEKNHLFREQYVKFMKEYESLGHMRELDSSEVPRFGYYIPHHGIMSVANDKVKFRVVFNASAKTSSGESLNDHLMVGATVQQFIYSIIVRFRQHKFVFSCDIEKMYRQFQIHQDDRHLQRVVWRNSPMEPIKHYELLTVTYGTASAPFLATRALKQLALDSQSSHPHASVSLLDDAYVDDIMTGANSISSLLQLKDELIEVIQEAGMNLAKWASNSNTFFESDNIPKSSDNSKDINFQESVSVLGIKWSPDKDVFIFKVKLPDSFIITKRSILSEASRIFDPIGWLAPIIVRIKILYQKLWLISVAWDDKLPVELEDEWKVMRSELKDIEKISIQRWYGTESGSIELHGFGDASEAAYGAAIYIRTQLESGEWKSSLVSAKTRVAPIKKLSIPRLELCAAVLVVDLMKQVSTSLKFQSIKIFYWTDSTTVLGWLSSHPGRWPTFIANRTSQILQVSGRDQWFHVSSKDNPADLASRGLSPVELFESNLWWYGSQWLVKPENTWPKQQHYSTSVELRGHVTVLATTTTMSVVSELVESSSKLHHMTKILAYILRFIKNCRIRDEFRLKRKSGLIDKHELNSALILIIKHSQDEHFQSEIHDIQQDKAVSKSSKLQSLNPFLDGDGVLRVGGRLAHALIPYETKHQVILSSKSVVTKRLVEDYHHRYFHASSSLLSNLLRQKYWIIRCKDVVKNVTSKCLQCFRMKPQPEEQQMGDLPHARVELVRPFVKVGCDFCGPFQVYHKRGRGQKSIKCYVCLFVCFGTKAIHLELVSSLATEAFIAAFRRLICRRGPCSDIYTDCGTNFVGANNYLKEVSQFLKTHHDSIYNMLLKDNITWHFNPPASPHQGGLWESMVKSVKTHLKKSTGNHILTTEEFTTLLCEVENVVNSRPLCVLSSDTVEALTPAHFIFHHAATYMPEIDLAETKLSNLSKWQIIQKLVQHFWRRWYNEYLILLQNRSKWPEEKENISIGDIVIIKDENLPPTKWKLARVNTITPGKDNLVRVVNVKTETGHLNRPIQKLCKLPIN